MKSLLVAGDYGIILEYTRDLMKFEQKNINKRGNDSNESFYISDDSYSNLPKGEPAIEIDHIDIKKALNETVSCLEFLINAICKSFNVSQK